MPLISDGELFSVAESRIINREAIEYFLNYCTRQTLPKKSIICRDGDMADSLLYIIEGSVSITTLDDDDNEIVLAYLSAGDFIGELGLFYLTQHRNAMVRSRTKCELASIEYDKLQALFKKELKKYHADILNAVGFQLAKRLLKTSRRVTRLAYMEVSGRIAQTLLELCDEPDAMSHPEGTQIHISRQEIGRIVGCSREVAGRVLKQMAEEGMIEIKGMDLVVYHSR